MAEAHPDYYIPEPSHWPITATISIFTMFVGGAVTLNGGGIGPTILGLGFLLFVFMLFGWFGVVIKESESGIYNDQVDVSFRMGMAWFIFSEVMFFAAFFGALYYARLLSLPWLGGEGTKLATNITLWPGFEATWPSNGPAGLGGEFQTIPAFDVPLVNTLILLTSGFTITMAHHALKEAKRVPCIAWMWATVALGALFLFFQAEEYIHAYNDLNLTMGSGIYGSTFFMLTGFHGMHVTLGTIMLLVITLRLMKGHFKPESHFGFEGVAWYWHFVDVVWIGLFIVVYWL